MKRHEPNRNTRAGFTLIEIMLVVVIIGILAGVAAVKFGGQVGKGQNSAAKASLSNLSMALGLYEIDNGSYPPTLQGLLAQPGNAPNWDGPYLETPELPRDPWGNDFHYAYPSSRGPKFFDLKCLGADGVESDDDITR